ncbi:MAG: nucleoside phosphorylase [Bacteroidetes bacterium]|nr:nucleoside phosphorylase [Bacteroidota bacterium]
MPKNYTASELILNPDGSVYHLGLVRDQAAETILLVGDPGRVAVVSSMFDRVETIVEKREFLTHTGWIGDKRISVISTGIGTDNIDIVVNELDILFNADLSSGKRRQDPVSLKLIRLGTSGGIVPSIPLGTAVISRYSIGLDNLIFFYRENVSLKDPELDRLFEHSLPSVHPYLVEGSETLISLLKPAGILGTTITAPGFYAPQGRNLMIEPYCKNLLEILGSYSYKGINVLNMEMESSALYALAGLMGHEAVTVCSVLANRNTGVYIEDPEKVIKRMIESCLGLLEGL